MLIAMVAKAMAMAMVTKAKVRVDQMAAMMASRESEVAGVAACPLGDDWEIPDTRQGPTILQNFLKEILGFIRYWRH